MRGNPCPPAQGRRAGGSIPAYAGEPPHCGASSIRCRVYPRVCGGTVERTPETKCSIGLSPRMRGNLHGQRALLITRRSIPAYAGEPRVAWCNGCQAGVYPRVCGGTADGQRRMIDRDGLSPRMRGNPCNAGARTDTARSIPAYAGEPPARPPVPARIRVYPRVCGGTSPNRMMGADSVGLSPRMRGNPRPLSEVAMPIGSIPAYAGEPAGGPAVPPPAGVYPRVCGGTQVGVGIQQFR